MDTRIKIILATGLLWCFTLTAKDNNDLDNAKVSWQESHPLDLNNFSGSIIATTDYIDRGISNTKERPAIQGSLDWNYSGFNLGVWGSNTNFSDNNIEIDYYGGYSWQYNNWNLDIAALYYTYPGENENTSDGLDPGEGQEADYWEFSFTPSYTFDENSRLLRSIRLAYFYSPDFFGEDGDAYAISSNVLLRLPYALSLNLLAGYQDVTGDKLTSGYDYTWWQTGISREFMHVNFDISYHGVDDEDDACDSDLCDARLIFTMSYTFPPED